MKELEPITVQRDKNGTIDFHNLAAYNERTGEKLTYKAIINSPEMRKLMAIFSETERQGLDNIKKWEEILYMINSSRKTENYYWGIIFQLHPLKIIHIEEVRKILMK